MMFLYNLVLYVLAALLLPPALVLAAFNPGWRKGISERLGIIPVKHLEEIKGKKPVWFHAASVGEVQALIPVIKEIASLETRHSIIATVTSLNGKKKLIEGAGKHLVFVSLMPLDVEFIIKGFIRKIDPEMIVIVETEFWPNLIHSASLLKKDLVLINGRISHKSFRFYRLFGFFFGKLLKKFRMHIMQSEKNFRRLQKIGAANEGSLILSNTKYSSGSEGMRGQDVDFDRKNKAVIVAGSIRKGEEETVIKGFLYAENGDSVLIFAPRHLKRIPFAAKILESEKIQYKLWTEINDYNIIPEYRVILLNTMGELYRIYYAADIAVIGGGFGRYGGHNPLEAAAASLPVIMGKNMYNFEDTAEKLLKGGGALQAENTAESIGRALKQLIDNRELAGNMGKINFEAVEKMRGTAETTAMLINELIIEKNADRRAGNTAL